MGVVTAVVMAVGFGLTLWHRASVNSCWMGMASRHYWAFTPPSTTAALPCAVCEVYLATHCVCMRLYVLLWWCWCCCVAVHLSTSLAASRWARSHFPKLRLQSVPRSCWTCCSLCTWHRRCVVNASAHSLGWRMLCVVRYALAVGDDASAPTHSHNHPLFSRCVHELIRVRGRLWRSLLVCLRPQHGGAPTCPLPHVPAQSRHQ